MATNDVAGGRVYHVWDIPRHNFVSDLCTLKPKQPKKLKKLKTYKPTNFFKIKTSFFQALV